MSLQIMRDERAALTTELRDLVGKKDWNPETDQPVYDEKMAKIDALDKRIENHNNMNRLAAEHDGGGMVLEYAAKADGKNSKARELYNKFLRYGNAALTEDDWASIRNTMSTTTGSEGGFTVQTEVASQILDSLKEYGGIRAIADVMRTENGSSMNYPTSDGTSEVGEIVGENAPATALDIAFGVKTLGVYKYSSKVIAVPIELLQDSQADIEAFVNARIRTRLGRITSQHFTTGTGTGQPTGFVTAASVGKTLLTGKTVTFDFDDLIDLEHSIDPAYRMGGACRFAMNDGSLKVAKKLKDLDGRPIFMPAYDLSVSNQAGELLGYPIEILQEMAAPGANAKSVAFGDFTYYKIRDAMDIMFHRFTDSAYATKGQVGFLAFLRSGGNLIDVGGAIKTMQHSAT